MFSVSIVNTKYILQQQSKGNLNFNSISFTIYVLVLSLIFVNQLPIKLTVLSRHRFSILTQFFCTENNEFVENLKTRTSC